MRRLAGRANWGRLHADLLVDPPAALRLIGGPEELAAFLAQRRRQTAQ
jgi:hypothetical protein